MKELKKEDGITIAYVRFEKSERFVSERHFDWVEIYLQKIILPSLDVRGIVESLDRRYKVFVFGGWYGGKTMNITSDNNYEEAKDAYRNFKQRLSNYPCKMPVKNYRVVDAFTTQGWKMEPESNVSNWARKHLNKLSGLKIEPVEVKMSW